MARNRRDRRNTNANARTNSKTISISLRDRGQTTQDFAVGIGIFLLAIAFVFSYMPSLLTPFSSSVDSGTSAQTDRIVATMIDDLSEDPDRPNHLNGTAFDDAYNKSNSTALANALGLRATDEMAIDRVNVSVEKLNQSMNRSERQIDNLTGGDPYSGESAASAGRIVTIDAGDVEFDERECEPACRLVVRVWET